MKERNTSKVSKAIKKSLDFETTLEDIRKKNEKRAWTVASISTLISLCLIGGLIYILPLKQKEPYLIMANVYTGQTTVAKLTGSWNDNSITKQEAVNKSNIAHFLIARESFDSQLIYDNDWATVYAMSTPNVSGSYRTLMNKGNPNSPFNLYGTTQSIKVKILSIVLNNTGRTDGRNPSATVRFQRFLLNKSTGMSRYIDSSIATVTYTYNDNLKMDEKYRIINPLGFQVTAYRVDPDSTVPVSKELSYPDMNTTIDSGGLQSNNSQVVTEVSQIGSVSSAAK